MSSKTNTKYVGMDVHKNTISVAVLNTDGKLTMESVIATEREAILDFVQGLAGTVHLTFEEGTYSSWLYPLLVRRVAKLIVCNPRKNALLKSGNHNDRVDAKKLAELLRLGHLSSVYHADHGLQTLKELGRAYTTLTEDTTRIMGRLKALYRGQAIPSDGHKLYSRRRRTEWLQRLPAQPKGLRARAERLFEQLDAVQKIRCQARAELLAESRRQPAHPILRSIPFLGPIWTALLLARLQTPHRFRTKRQLWTYSGLGLETHSSGDYRFVEGQLQRRQKPVFVKGLNFHHQHELKRIFKNVATAASARPGPWREFYLRLIDHMEPDMARLTLARKIAAVTLAVWKKGERFDPQHLNRQAA
jgi:transposase